MFGVIGLKYLSTMYVNFLVNNSQCIENIVKSLEHNSNFLERVSILTKVCIYLRKSRADEEAEKYGEGETLSKHRKALIDVAKNMSLNVIKIREEIVSGESLIHRPEMLELLKEVESGNYDAVLCMDLDRLGRGNMQEQGLILETFKKSNTKIITPRKTYDLRDEFDEEYSEFEAFMARKELKLINRRLQAGRIRSIKEGNYVGTNPHYGYNIHFIGKSRTLRPHPEQAPIVQLIFELYSNQGYGGNKIANKLNEMGYKSATGISWTNSSVLNIIKNEVYIGKIQWGKKEYRKSSIPGQSREIISIPRSEWISVKGKHEPLISKETFEKAQQILAKKSHAPYSRQLTNPMAGLIKCEDCGCSMVQRTYTGNRDPHIMCYNSCGNKSSKLKFVEQRLLDGLKEWLDKYKAEWEDIKPKNKASSKREHILLEKALSSLKNELNETEKQKNNLHDLLERGIYDIDTYLERSRLINDKIDNIKMSIAELENNINDSYNKKIVHKDLIPKFEKVLDMYNKTDDVKKKNDLLKSILDYAVYKKEKSQRNDNFTLILHPKLPK